MTVTALSTCTHILKCIGVLHILTCTCVIGMFLHILLDFHQSKQLKLANSHSFTQKQVACSYMLLSSTALKLSHITTLPVLVCTVAASPVSKITCTYTMYNTM